MAPTSTDSASQDRAVPEYLPRRYLHTSGLTQGRLVLCPTANSVSYLTPNIEGRRPVTNTASLTQQGPCTPAVEPVRFHSRATSPVRLMCPSFHKGPTWRPTQDSFKMSLCLKIQESGSDSGVLLWRSTALGTWSLLGANTHPITRQVSTRPLVSPTQLLVSALRWLCPHSNQLSMTNGEWPCSATGWHTCDSLKGPPVHK